MNKRRILLQNKAQCRKCGDVLISKYRHDFKSCGCGAIHVDGGLEYVKRSAFDPDDIIELSKYELLPNRILFLDDNNERIETAIKYFSSDDYDLMIAKTAHHAIKLLKIQGFELVYLDHDLGGEVFVNSNREDCGMEVVRWMCSNKMKINVGRVIVHSWNYPAATEMRNKLKDAGYDVCQSPFSITI